MAVVHPSLQNASTPLSRKWFSFLRKVTCGFYFFLHDVEPIIKSTFTFVETEPKFGSFPLTALFDAALKLPLGVCLDYKYKC